MNNADDRSFFSGHYFVNDTIAENLQFPVLVILHFRNHMTDPDVFLQSLRFFDNKLHNPLGLKWRILADVFTNLK